jgi:hypothetical protein
MVVQGRQLLIGCPAVEHEKQPPQAPGECLAEEHKPEDNRQHGERHCDDSEESAADIGDGGAGQGSRSKPRSHKVHRRWTPLWGASPRISTSDDNVRVGVRIVVRKGVRRPRLVFA